jgi:hypothetical protein
MKTKAGVGEAGEAGEASEASETAPGDRAGPYIDCGILSILCTEDVWEK